MAQGSISDVVRAGMAEAVRIALENGHVIAHWSQDGSDTWHGHCNKSSSRCAAKIEVNSKGKVSGVTITDIRCPYLLEA